MGWQDAPVVSGAQPAWMAAPVVGKIPLIPGDDADRVEGQYANRAPPEAAQPAEPGTLDRIVGAGETALTLATSGVAAPIVHASGAIAAGLNALLTGEYDPEIKKKASELVEQLTYSPRTQAGQEMTRDAGQFIGANAPSLGPAGAELSAIGRGASLAAPVIKTAAGATLEKAATGVPALLRTPGAEMRPTPGTLGSAGAAGADMAAQRRALAAEFEIPPLTKGQAACDPMQLKFEGEVAKTEAGTPLRERSLEQESAVRAKLDEWVDATGAERPLPYDAGMYVDDVLRAQNKRDRAKVRTEYTEAGKSKEAQTPIDLNKSVQIGEGDTEFTGSVLGYLNSKPTGLATTGLTDFARKSAEKLGIATEVDGNMRALPATMKQVQDWRREISQATGVDPTHIQNATVLKRLIDATADPVAGPLYQRARASRVRLAQNYDNHRVISQLLKDKPGTTDRRVAFEDVFDHIVLKGGIDDVQQARRILQRAGPEGHQAWAEMRGQTLRWIRDKATNFTRDSTDNKVISPAGLDKAIAALDEGGSETSKLMLIFGKKGAQQLRDINDLVQYIKTVPPETALNRSNTAATLTALADGMLMGASGLPAPFLSGSRWAVSYIKDVRLRRRVSESLGTIEAKPIVSPPPAPSPTVH